MACLRGEWLSLQQTSYGRHGLWLPWPMTACVPTRAVAHMAYGSIMPMGLRRHIANGAGPTCSESTRYICGCAMSFCFSFSLCSCNGVDFETQQGGRQPQTTLNPRLPRWFDFPRLVDEGAGVEPWPSLTK